MTPSADLAPTVPVVPPAFLPTTTSLPPAEMPPSELAQILAATAERQAQAEAALAAAQDHFDAANREREYALSEEQKRRELDEEARINRLRSTYASLVSDVDAARREFYLAFEEGVFDASRVMKLFIDWNIQKVTSGRVRSEILHYDATRSADVYESWLRRIYGWEQLIRSVTSWKHGGLPANQYDDPAGLAEVNERINAESQDAPRTLRREPTDQSTPFVEDLGLRDPMKASMDNMLAGDQNQPLSFEIEFNKAAWEAATNHANNYLADTKKTEETR